MSGYNLGGVNGSGQIPTLQNLPLLIDKDTDPAVYARTGHDGQKYSLVFSDEFQTPGRTFYPGDDPYFEAVNLHYWQTGDFEYYDPASVTTEDGFMKIELRQVPIRGLNFQSGMVQTWNKFCFQTGYLESLFLQSSFFAYADRSVSVILPGSGQIPGFWPGLWTRQFDSSSALCAAHDHSRKPW